MREVRGQVGFSTSVNYTHDGIETSVSETGPPYGFGNLQGDWQSKLWDPLRPDEMRKRGFVYTEELVSARNEGVIEVRSPDSKILSILVKVSQNHWFRIIQTKSNQRGDLNSQ